MLEIQKTNFKKGYLKSHLNQIDWNHKSEFPLNLEIENLDLNLCTDVMFDFEKRIWTDDSNLNSEYFLNKWEQKFGMLWDNLVNVSPLQPYQPEIVHFRVGSENRTVYIESAGIVTTTDPKKRWYKCKNDTQFSLASFSYAFNDCKGLNSSILTYWDEVKGRQSTVDFILISEFSEIRIE